MNDVLVLCYHAVADRWPAALSVTPDALEDQLGLLVERGYRGATFHEAIHDPPWQRTVAVTFDDGYRSVVDRAFPVLAKLGLPATVFVVTSFAGRDSPMSWPGIDGWLDGPHAPELAPASWPQLEALADAGWEIGSHSDSHPRLPTLDDDRLAAELSRSREICEERVGKPCRSLAYPYGDLDDRVIAAAKRAGYGAAATLTARLHHPEPLRWPRVGVYHDDGLLRFRTKVSPSVRRLRASRAWSLVEPQRR